MIRLTGQPILQAGLVGLAGCLWYINRVDVSLSLAAQPILHAGLGGLAGHIHNIYWVDVLLRPNR
jgi:hypothetical protein